MRLLSIIFLLQVAVSAYSESCPPEEEMAPCFCHNDEFSGNILVNCLHQEEESKPQVLTNAIKSLVGKKNVEIIIVSFNMTKVPLKLFDGIGVVKLQLSNCAVHRITEEEQVLVGLEDSLEKLTISSSMTEDSDLTHLKFGHLRKLKELQLYSNAIPNLSAGWFDNSKVEDLKLANNNFEKIEDRAFVSLSNLKIFELWGNDFGTLKRSVLPNPANHLTSLDLSYNSFTSLEEDIFSNMPALKSVWLMGNKISTLDQGSWESVWEQLDYININENPIQCDSDLKWTFDLRRPTIRGVCGGPENMKGRSLEDFIDNGKKK